MAIKLTNTSFRGRLKFSGSSNGGFKCRTSGIDPDVQAFFSRVTAAGGTLTATEQTAVNTLVSALKSAGVWTLMKAIYPMVGASAAACAQNLKSSSFIGTFTGGWTFTSAGVTGNGTSAYMGTSIIPSVDLELNSGHLSIYSRTNVEDSSSDLSSESNSGTNQQILLSRYTGLGFVASYGGYLGAASQVANTDSRGLFVTNRNSSTNVTAFKNSVKVLDYANASSLSTLQLVLGAQNFTTGISRFSIRQYAFASIGDGLSDINASDFYTAVQAFQTTLSRQV